MAASLCRTDSSRSSSARTSRSWSDDSSPREYCSSSRSDTVCFCGILLCLLQSAGALLELAQALAHPGHGEADVARHLLERHAVHVMHHRHGARGCALPPEDAVKDVAV